MKLFKKANKREVRKVKVTILNLFNNDIETAVISRDGISNLICHGFDILKVEEI